MSSEKKNVFLEPVILSLLNSEDESRRLIEGRSIEELGRMLQLASSLDCNLEKLNWYEVALKLAKKHEPLLQEKRKNVRNGKWGFVERVLLAGEVERNKDKFPVQKELFATLASKEPWKSFVSKKDGTLAPDPSDALRKQYKKRDKYTGLIKVVAHENKDCDKELWEEKLNLVGRNLFSS